MEPDDNLDEDEPLHPWLPPDDRLWRHPSEMVGGRSPVAPDVAPEGAPGGAAPARPRGGRQHAVGGSRSGTGVLVRDMDRRLCTVALLAGLVGALVASSAGMAVGQFQHTTVVRPVEQVINPDSLITIAATPQGNDIGDIATRLRPTIVELLADTNGTDVTGSGVIFRSDGYILTNEHIVDGAQSMVAILSNGERISCRLIGADQATDIAVVKLESSKPQAVATLGTSSGLRVGQLAIALGSPVGLAGNLSVSSGIISAVDSQVSPSEGPTLTDMIQTDAAIDPGSSGGALVDGNGMVVGITTTVAVGDAGAATLGLATPIEVARDVANQLLTTGHVVHAWLGIEGSDVDSVTAEADGVTGGALVENVDQDSPAARAGLVASDVVVSFDGQPINSMYDLDASVREHQPGDKVSITYIRGSETRTADIVLLQPPDDDYP